MRCPLEWRARIRISLQGLSGGKCPPNPEADVADPKIGSDSYTVSRTEVLRIEMPGTSPDHMAITIASRRPWRSIVRSPVIASMYAILHPFEYVAVHVVQPEQIGRKRADRGCLL